MVKVDGLAMAAAAAAAAVAAGGRAARCSSGISMRAMLTLPPPIWLCRSMPPGMTTLPATSIGLVGRAARPPGAADDPAVLDPEVRDVAVDAVQRVVDRPPVSRVSILRARSKRPPGCPGGEARVGHSPRLGQGRGLDRLSGERGVARGGGARGRARRRHRRSEGPGERRPGRLAAGGSPRGRGAPRRCGAVGHDGRPADAACGAGRGGRGRRRYRRRLRQDRLFRRRRSCSLRRRAGAAGSQG